MVFKIVLLAGDGVGPEVMREAVKVLKAVESAYGVSFDLVPFPCGGQHHLETGGEWPDGGFGSWKTAGAVFPRGAGLPGGGAPDRGGARGGGVLWIRIRPGPLAEGPPHQTQSE